MGLYYLALRCLMLLSNMFLLIEVTLRPPAHAHYIPLWSFYPLIWQLPTDVRQLGFNHKAVGPDLSLLSVLSVGSSEAGKEQDKGMLCCFCLVFFPSLYLVSSREL